MNISFPIYHNVFTEEAAKQPKTQFSILSNDNFLLNNSVKFLTKTPIKNDGSFTFKNQIATDDKYGTRIYYMSNDANLEYTYKQIRASLRSKINPSALQLQFQLDFPKYDAFRGTLSPFLKFDSIYNFNRLIPSFGCVFVTDYLNLTSKFFYSRYDRKLFFEESLKWNHGPWLASINTGMIMHRYEFQYYKTLLAYTHNDAELSFNVENSEGKIMPDNLQLNIFYKNSQHDLGAQVSFTGESLEKKGFRMVYKYKLSKDLWFKTAFDEKNNNETYTHFGWNNFKLGISFSQNFSSNGDYYEGNINYKFNWGLSLQVDA